MARHNIRDAYRPAEDMDTGPHLDDEGEWFTPFLDTIRTQVTREILSRALREICLSIGADQFCMADVSRSHAEEPPQILSANWTFDAIDLIGTSSIEQLYQSPHAAALGQLPALFTPAMIDRATRVIDARIISRLIEFGHCNVFLLKLRAGPRRGICIFSSAAPRQINMALLTRAHLASNYLMSRHSEISEVSDKDPLSDRERECLLWAGRGQDDAGNGADPGCVGQYREQIHCQFDT